MVTRKKIDLKKVLASLNETCPHCGYSIPPSEQMRLDGKRMLCPKCKKGVLLEDGAVIAAPRPRSRL
jgi:ribosomal protein S27AE